MRDEGGEVFDVEKGEGETVSKGTSYWAEMNAATAKRQGHALVDADLARGGSSSEGVLNAVFAVEPALQGPRVHQHDRLGRIG